MIHDQPSGHERRIAAAAGGEMRAREPDDVEAPQPRRLDRYYDRLRQRIALGLGAQGRLSSPAAGALLVVPDVFVLLVRMAGDREVPRTSRQLIVGSLVYFLVPTDLLPEVFVGVGGYLDDLILAVGVLAHVMSQELEPVVRRHWSGEEKLNRVVRDLVGTAHALLGESLYGRLQRVLSRRGVEI